MLEFTLQMVLILVFGHALAISKPVSSLLGKVSSLVKSNVHAVLLTGAVTMIAGYFNWGFGLILGAVLAKRIGNHAVQQGILINYPLVAASGYLGMMVWHGGFSGSAPLKVAEPNHFLVSEIGSISVSETILSKENILINSFLFFAIMITLWLLSRKKVEFTPVEVREEFLEVGEGKGYLGWIVGGFICLLGFGSFFEKGDNALGFIDLNYVNFLLLGFGMVAHKSLTNYTKAIQNALKGATGIILQFPFYGGILGVLKHSGLLLLISSYFVRLSSPDSFPFVTIMSAALVNVFVPSGGGQWAVQGPVIVEAAIKMGLPIHEMVMAMAYGDQLTNMVQPFWALPLLAITGVAPRDLLKYTIYFFVVGGIVFGLGVFLAF
ncbi:TIGR00366 family protein [Echinicola sp. 20G]|uniref:TIGR00366 family protein n=1 Tax=Echinicola sp. 20G TaxID=2781961 RepID=UPI001910A87C|nr:TIGR00366 family protein [Echinicola sp. 20G]